MRILSSSRFLKRIAASVFALSLWTGNALANGAAQTHDGFFLRMTAGFGYEQTSAEFGGIKEKYVGASGAANLAIGGVIASNLALHGTFFGWFAEKPDITIGPLSGEYGGDVTMSGVGAGVTYYLMPSNVYFSATLGGSQLEFNNSGGGTTSTDWGFAFDFNLGKEWWVSNNWALGLSGDVGFHNIPDATFTGADWGGYNFAILFSATFN